MSTDPDPTLHDIDAVLRFLPVVAQPGFEPGRMSEAVLDGASPTRAPHFEASPEMEDLIQALYSHNWISEFDWSEWQPVAERYVKNPALLRDVGLGTLRKLFTTHIRRERFCDGHLAEITRSGHLLALMKRLEEIRGGLKL